MDEKSLKDLKESLAKDDGQISLLDVESCFLSSTTIKELLVLASKCRNMKTLLLKENYLGGGDGVEALARFISSSDRLLTVDVRNNNLSYFDVENLILALKKNFSITQMKVFERFGRNKSAPFFVYLKSDAAEDELQWDAFTSQTLACQLEQIADLLDANTKIQECRDEKSHELVLRGRGITHLPDHILFSHLVILDIVENNLTALPAAINKLVNLQRLFADNNKLTLIPDEIGSLQKLQILSLRNNELRTLPSTMSLLLCLEELYIDNNRIAEPPLPLGSLVKLRKLEATNNPFLSHLPRDMKVDIVTYLRNLQRSGVAKKKYRMKLMFVGNGSVGKTSLLKALMSKKKTPKAGLTKKLLQNADKLSETSVATDGIDICEFPVKDKELIPGGEKLYFSAWDFAGQKVYYATHQFFLSQRSLYVLVFNLLRPEEENCLIEYWMQSISARAGDSPIVLVGTHTDECTPEQVEKSFQQVLDRIKAKKRYKNLVFYIDVSTHPQIMTNIAKLRKKLIEITMSQPHITAEEIPANFVTLEEKIVALKNTRPMPPVLTFDAYKKIAEACNLEKEDDILQASEFLYSLGQIVYFNEASSGLNQIVILDSQWLTQVFSTVISMKNQYAKDGIMKPSYFPHIWKPPAYPESLHSFLLKILEKFEICYKLDSEGNLLIPWMLPDKQPEDFSKFWKESSTEPQIARYYEFEFIPVGLFSKLMVRLLNSSSQWQPLCYWRSGIVFRLPGVRVLLTIDHDKSLLKLVVRGPQQTVALISLDEAINTLVEDWLMIKVNVIIPCPHCLEMDNEKGAHLFSFNELETAVKENLTTVNCMATKTPVAIPLSSMVPDITMTSLKTKIDYKDLQLGKELGEGAFAVVYEGLWRGEKVAIKKVKDDTLEGGTNVFSEFRREVWLMSSLQHENLCGLKAVCLEPFCMVLEFMNQGSLYDYLHNPQKPVDWNFRVNIGYEVAKAMEFLHGLKPPVVHRDLKSPNILLTSPQESEDSERGFLCEGRVLKAKVADFGLSRPLAFTAELDSKKLMGQNPVWLAPEVMQRKDYNEKIDIYSFGVILWEMLTRQDYFGEYRFFSEISEAVVSGKRPPVTPPKEPDPQNIFKEYAEILVACWDNDPTKRPPFKEIARRFAAMRLRLIRPSQASRMSFASSRPANVTTQRLNLSLRSTPSVSVKTPPTVTSPQPSSVSSSYVSSVVATFKKQ